jgi:hypothetical protein
MNKKTVLILCLLFSLIIIPKDIPVQMEITGLSHLSI